MSRGPGRVQRAIKAAFQAEPNNAFTTEELCRRVYGLRFSYESSVAKKQRVAVLRAAKNILGLAYFPTLNLGGRLVFYNPLNLKSFAMAQMKRLSWNYQNNDPRSVYPADTEAALRRRLSTPEFRKLMRKDGEWWRYVELAKAKAHGDHKRAAELYAALHP